MSLPDSDAEQTVAQQTHKLDSDLWLQMLVSFAEQKVRVSVTVLSGGMLISGMLCSTSEYFDAISASMSDGLETALGDSGTGIAASIKNMGDIDADKIPIENLRFIHISEPSFFNQSRDPIVTKVINGPSVVWRGQISKVDGFTMGTLQLSN